MENTVETEARKKLLGRSMQDMYDFILESKHINKKPGTVYIRDERLGRKSNIKIATVHSDPSKPTVTLNTPNGYLLMGSDNELQKVRGKTVNTTGKLKSIRME